MEGPVVVTSFAWYFGFIVVAVVVLVAVGVVVALVAAVVVVVAVVAVVEVVAVAVVSLVLFCFLWCLFIQQGCWGCMLVVFLVSHVIVYLHCVPSNEALRKQIVFSNEVSNKCVLFAISWSVALSLEILALIHLSNLQCHGRESSPH